MTYHYTVFNSHVCKAYIQSMWDLCIKFCVCMCIFYIVIYFYIVYCHWLNCASQKRYWRPKPQYPKMLPDLEIGSLAGIFKLRWGHQSRPYSKMTGVLIKRESLDSETDMHGGKIMWRHRKTTIYKPRDAWGYKMLWRGMETHSDSS